MEIICINFAEKHLSFSLLLTYGFDKGAILPAKLFVTYAAILRKIGIEYMKYSTLQK